MHLLQVPYTVFNTVQIFNYRQLQCTYAVFRFHRRKNCIPSPAKTLSTLRPTSLTLYQYQSFNIITIVLKSLLSLCQNYGTGQLYLFLFHLWHLNLLGSSHTQRWPQQKALGFFKLHRSRSALSFPLTPSSPLSIIHRTVPSFPPRSWWSTSD